jgi:hypothetical protein
MPKRPGHIPNDRELDQFAKITYDAIDDAVRTMKQRVPASGPLLDAIRDDRAGGATGPIADEA